MKQWTSPTTKNYTGRVYVGSEIVEVVNGVVDDNTLSTTARETMESSSTWSIVSKVSNLDTSPQGDQSTKTPSKKRVKKTRAKKGE